MSLIDYVGSACIVIELGAYSDHQCVRSCVMYRVYMKLFKCIFMRYVELVELYELYGES